MKNTWLFCKLKTLMLSPEQCQWGVLVICTENSALAEQQPDNLIDFLLCYSAWEICNSLRCGHSLQRAMRNMPRQRYRCLNLSVTCTKPQRTSTSMGLFKTCKHIPQRSRTRQDEAEWKLKYFAKQSKMIYCNLCDNVNYAALCGTSQEAEGSQAGRRQVSCTSIKSGIRNSTQLNYYLSHRS